MKTIGVSVLFLARVLVPDPNAFSQESPEPPWSTDVVKTRKRARAGRKPCVVILNINARAL